MSDQGKSGEIRNLAMISHDTELVALAKGAFSNNEQQNFVCINKAIGEIGAEIRDLNCDAIIVDLDASNVEDFESLQKVKRMLGANTEIIVISSDFSPAATRILIQLKVTDFLAKPVQTSDLVRACNNALKQSGEDAQMEPQFLAFMPASGGVGTTMAALETAAILNRHGKPLGRTTCVVDLNFQHGSCAEYLDIEPRFDISEIENAPERLDRQLLDVMLSKHESGLSVISAPNQPTEMRTFKPALVVRLLDLVSAYFDYVVIDLPRIWFPWTDTVIMGSNKLFIIADMTVPSIRHAKRLIDAVEDKIGNQADPKVIVNRMDQRKNENGLNYTDVEASLGEYLAGGIPNNYMLVRAAVDRGVPLSTIEADNNVTAALKGIILENEAEDIKNDEKLSGLISLGRRLLIRKAS
ncbi:MAG: response regulator receiver protein [Hyphomicrobiales bacterium]|nr:MAG: response regulator receiver protein [Hyphomicrobiales bacterium]